MSGGLELLSSPPLIILSLVLVGAAGLAVLWFEDERHVRYRRWVEATARRVSRRNDLSWVDRTFLTLAAAVGFTFAVVLAWALGNYGCTPAGPSDLATLVASGQAFLHGGDPFSISACGRTGNPVPAGIASVLLVALGSLGGEPGVLAVLGITSVALIPLLWELGGPARARSTLFALVSFLYLPIVAVQVDGASLAFMPLTLLLALMLARSNWPRAALVGGFLSTGRFPSLFPWLGATGRARGRRWLALLLSLGTFGGVSLVAYAVYRGSFLGPVLLEQLTRSHLSLSYWGILQGEGWLQPSLASAIVQAALLLLAVGVVFFRARREIGAVAVVLTATILLTPFLSYDELIFLLPVALVSPRARGWLWAIGLTGSVNTLLAMRSLSSLGGPNVLSYALDAIFTGLVLGLLFDLAWTELGPEDPGERGTSEGSDVGTGRGGPGKEQGRGSVEPEPPENVRSANPPGLRRPCSFNPTGDCPPASPR